MAEETKPTENNPTQTNSGQTNSAGANSAAANSGETNSDRDLHDPDTLFEFPCEFPVKVMGRNEKDFQELVEKIVFSHAKAFEDKPVTTNPSGSGNFISVTITIEAVSKAQLDAIYQDLTDCKQVVMAL